MSDFDPYLKWLGIRDPERPPNHYRLLGVEEFESDSDVISAAADRQMTHVRSFQNGPDADISQRLLSELALARRCLMSPERRQEYDVQLRQLKSEWVENEPPVVAVNPPAISLEAVPQVTTRRSPPEYRSKKSRKQISLPLVLTGMAIIIGLLIGVATLVVIWSSKNNAELAEGDGTSRTGSQKSSDNGSKKSTDQGQKGNPGNGKAKQKDKIGKSNDPNDPFMKPPWDLEPVYATTLPGEFVNEDSEIQIRLQPVYFALAIRENKKAELILNAILNDPKYNGETMDLPGVQACIDAVNHQKRFWANYEIALAGVKKDVEFQLRGRFVKVASVNPDTRQIDLQAGDGSSRSFETNIETVDRDLATEIVMIKQKPGRKFPEFLKSFRRVDFVNQLDLVETKFDLEQVIRFAEKAVENSNPFGSEGNVTSTTGPDVGETVNPDPKTGGTDSNVEPIENAKSEIPSTADLAAALKSIKKGYADLYESRDPAIQQDLAKQLLVDAGADDLEPASRYAMLEEARRLFVLLGNPTEGMKSVDQLEQHFQFDYFDLGRQTLEAIGRKIKAPEDRKELVRSWTLLWQKGVAQDEFTSALLIISKTSAALKKLGDNDSYKKLQIVRSEVSEMKRLASAADKAAEQLKLDEDDPAANLAIGKFLCFVKNDFVAGLPRLSRGSDLRLKKAADLELKELENEKAEKPLEIAQSWFDLAAGKGLQAKRMKIHAAEWFRVAESNLDGLKKKEIEKVLEEIDALETGFDVSNISGFGRYRFLGDSKWRIVWAGYETWEEAQFTADGTVTYFLRNEKRTANWKLTAQGIHIERRRVLLLLVPTGKKSMIARRYTIRSQRLREEATGQATALEPFGNN